MSTFFIAERLVKVVATHVVKNSMADVPPGVPLILGVHGPSGSGKTFQCGRVFQDMQAEIFPIDASQLESADAGAPAQMLRDTYLEADLMLTSKKAKLAVIFLNDIDAGLGNWGELVQTTVNTQLVIAELMHMADEPNRIGRKKTKRIPIVATGNDFRKLYGPLVRAGRMLSYEWRPRKEEIAMMMTTLFVGLSVSDCIQVIDGLVYATGVHPENLQIAFFAQLRSHLDDEAIWGEIKSRGLSNVGNLVVGRGYRIERRPHRVNELIARGTPVLLNAKHRNHLHDGE